MDPNGRPALYCTVNNTPNPQGLFLQIDKTDNVMLLNHSDNVLLAQWKLEHLIEQFERKMPNLLVVLADSRITNNGKEEFWYNTAYLLENGNKNVFIDFIKKGIIIVDIRIHLKEKGTVRNHGTAFRIEEKKLVECFINKIKLF